MGLSLAGVASTGAGVGYRFRALCGLEAGAGLPLPGCDQALDVAAVGPERSPASTNATDHGAATRDVPFSKTVTSPLPCIGLFWLIHAIVLILVLTEAVLVLVYSIVMGVGLSSNLGGTAIRLMSCRFGESHAMNRKTFNVELVVVEVGFGHRSLFRARVRVSGYALSTSTILSAAERTDHRVTRYRSESDALLLCIGLVTLRQD